MQKIISLNRKSVIALALCMTFLLGYMPFSADRAYAADGSITLKVGREIDYSSHRTHYFYAGDKDSPVYCAQPQLPTPKSGKYSYSLIRPDSMLAKCLFYGYGGPGFADYTDKQLSGQWDNEDDAYCLTHIIISIAYDKTTSADVDPFYGLTDAWKNKAKSLYEYVKGLPDPPVNYRAYQIKVAGCQDILGSFNDTGSIRLQKSSSNTVITDGNPNYSLAGAKYGVYYGNTLIGTITTDENGTGTLENVLAGDYTVKEMEPSAGYAIEVSEHNVSVKADQRTDISVKEVPQSNPMDILLEKLDSETDKAEPQGAASLEGAEFKVEFYATFSGPRSAKAKAGADRTWIFKTDAEGKVRFTKDYLVSGDDFYYQSDGKTICLPLGKVVITETKAPEGYLLNGEVFTAYITSSGVKETVKTYNEQSVPEQVKRGDLEFVKVSDGDLKRLEGVPFTITSLTTGESHTIVTDKNGYASTAASWNRHTHNTNAGKTSEDGIWFGTSKPDDSKGALIYDDYEIAEQRCKANEGMDLLKVKVSVYRDSVTIPMGTMTDDLIEIETTAKDAESGTHFGKPEGKVTIVDTVEYKGLKKGETYKLTGTLMNKETGKSFMVNGKPVTAEKTFKARRSSGTVDMVFTVDGELLKGKTSVVFEDLYQDDIKLAIHADIEDEGQTVYYPEIGTTAKYDTGEKVSKAEKSVTIEDTVKYSGLQAGKSYTMKGTLMDKSTGKSLIVDGKEVTASKTFTADKPSGEVIMSFMFDASALSSTEIVVFENLYKDSTEIAVHADINDEGQTVSLESDRPPASPKTGDDMEFFILFALMIAAGVSATAVRAISRKKCIKEDKNEE